MSSPDGLLLFSGGLDSILAARLLLEQGLKIVCLHLTSPFFGDPEAVPHWRQIHELDIRAVDIGREFVSLLLRGPEHGFGKVMNPCVDCKILFFRKAKEIMLQNGARFIASGEVLAQRPMSQRRDALHLIQKDADAPGIILRPLSARLLPPTLAEENGLVDREKLLGISGRGRAPQLALAGHFGLKEIPAPAGGCLLAEKENGCRYWRILKSLRARGAPDPALAVREFELARHGRQLWRKEGGFRLCVGRVKADNQELLARAGPDDITLRLTGLPGPLALAVGGRAWPPQILEEAAAITAGYSPRARASGAPANVSARGPGFMTGFGVWPDTAHGLWGAPGWEDTRTEIKAENRGRVKDAGHE